MEAVSIPHPVAAGQLSHAGAVAPFRMDPGSLADRS